MQSFTTVVDEDASKDHVRGPKGREKLRLDIVHDASSNAQVTSSALLERILQTTFHNFSRHSSKE